MPAPDLLSIEMVAERAEVDPRTVRRWIASGALFSVRVGRNRRVPVESYEAFRLAAIEAAASDDRRWWRTGSKVVSLAQVTTSLLRRLVAAAASGTPAAPPSESEPATR